MEITFINVGYGDAILIQSGDFTLLLDGGSALPAEFDGYPHRIRAADYLAAAGVSRIDLLLLSHIHEDHACGLEAVLESIPVGEIRIPYDPALFAQRHSFSPAETAPRSAHLFSAALGSVTRLVTQARDKHIPVSRISIGDHLALQNESVLTVLAPVEGEQKRFEALLQQAFSALDPTEALVQLDRTSNDSSLLLKLESKGTAVLLAADNCPDKWRLADASVLENVNVLKLPHHGQKDSISEEILRQMPLTHAITTASSDRRYHSANPVVYDTLLRLHPGIQLLFTDERAYPPYFTNPSGACAIKLVIDSEGIFTEFINNQPSDLRLEAFL